MPPFAPDHLEFVAFELQSRHRSVRHRAFSRSVSNLPGLTAVSPFPPFEGNRNAQNYFRKSSVNCSSSPLFKSDTAH